MLSSIVEATQDVCETFVLALFRRVSRRSVGLYQIGCLPVLVRGVALKFYLEEPFPTGELDLVHFHDNILK